MIQALNDKYHGLRGFTMSKLDLEKETVRKEMENCFTAIWPKMIRNRSFARAALDVLSHYDNPAYKAFL